MSLEVFHFIRPEWLLLLPAVVFLYLYLNRISSSTNWQNYLPQKTLEVLRVKQSSKQVLIKWSLLICLSLIVIAASGPSWIKQSLPALQNQRALVILLDLSPSMLAADVKPDRISRARYELLDVLRLFKDGQIGLVAYAGSAHIVSPLTDDPSSIGALVPALSPTIMPQQGSNIEEAVNLAQRLLDDAGFSGGEILLISDGVEADAINTIASSLRNWRSLSILGIGGTEPTPIPRATRGFVRDSNSEIVLAKLPVDALRSLANLSGGRFLRQTNDDSDITSLIDNKKVDVLNLDHDSQGNQEYDSWLDMGFIFVLCALPLFLLLFRKGTIYVVFIAVFAPLSFNVEAAELSWRDLFQNKDQQAAELMNKNQYPDAASTFKRKDWSAAAHYRSGNYDKTIEQLEGREDTLSLYNKATALAMSGDFAEAIESYQRVLEQQADHADAAHNKQVLEELLKQQEQQDGKQKSDQENSKDSDSQGGDSKDQDTQPQESKENKSGEQQSGGQQGGDPSEQAQNKQNEPAQQEQQDDRSSDNSDSQRANEDEAKSLSEKDNEPPQTGEAQEQKPNANEDDKNNPPEQGSDQLEVSQEQGDDSQQPQDSLENVSQVTPLSADSEQWLRGIKDDPSGLLRRKFEYQARQHKKNSNSKTRAKRTTSSEIRY